MNRTLAGISVWRIAIVIAAALVLLWASQVANTAQPPSITIDAGLKPHLSGSEAIALAQSQIAAMAQSVGRSTSSSISSARAVRGSEISKIEATAPTLDDAEADQTYWIVRGTGTYLATRGRGPDKVFATGYLIIDDATGDVIGMGMP